MHKYEWLKLKFWRNKERRGVWLNSLLTLLEGGLGLGLVQLGLLQGRGGEDAPIFFDSPDMQTLTASAFIGLGALLLLSGFRLGLFSLKWLADLIEGPALLVGFITTREADVWRRRFGRILPRYRLYLVSRQAFPLWLRGHVQPEGQPTLGWVTNRRLPVINPTVFQVPIWAYEMVREGDLIQLHYARWRRIVLEVKIVESVLPPLPAPNQPNQPSDPRPEIETAQWRVIEED